MCRRAHRRPGSRRWGPSIRPHQELCVAGIIINQGVDDADPRLGPERACVAGHIIDQGVDDESIAPDSISKTIISTIDQGVDSRELRFSTVRVHERGSPISSIRFSAVPQAQGKMAQAHSSGGFHLVGSDEIPHRSVMQYSGKIAYTPSGHPSAAASGLLNTSAHHVAADSSTPGGR